MDGERATARVGCAGWTVPRRHVAEFPSEGSHLERYAARFPAVEINSSFYRPHRRATYERWAASTPEHFRFAVKAPKTLTHERRLVGGDEELERFLGEIGGLGAKLGPILVQLPPSLAFDRTIVRLFFERLRARHAGSVACEPRHASWFTLEGESTLTELSIARVAADPARAEGAEEFGGWPGLAYLRLHGTPKVYYSEYGAEELARWTEVLARAAAANAETWCIFDNTALDAAQGNALATIELLRAATCPTASGPDAGAPLARKPRRPRS